MKIITQCGLLFFICLCGMFLARLFPFPVPASVVSMLLLFGLLLAGAVRPSALKETSDVLLGNMAFFFLPSGVGILAHVDTIKGSTLALLAVCFVTTFLTFAASAGTVVAVAALQRRLREGRTPR